MAQIDDLFGQFIHEQEILGRADKTISGLRQSFRLFRKLMPEVEIQNVNEELILDFGNKLRKVKIWNNIANDFVLIKTATILNSMIYLRSFFIWLKKQDHQSNTSVNPKEPEPKKKVDKLAFLIHYRQKFDLLLNSKCESKIMSTNYFDNDLLIKQLTRRYNSFFNLNNPVFFKGIADYVKFISEINQLLDMIRNEILVKEKTDLSDFTETSCSNSEYLESLRQNSEWGSWFNLEFVYLLIYRTQELLAFYQSESDVQMFLNSCLLEMKRIFANCLQTKYHYFIRDNYNTDLIRVHNFIIDVLERSKELRCNKLSPNSDINYKYHSNAIPSGELMIKGFELICFAKNPAMIIQFFYLNRQTEQYLSYKEFNEFLGSKNKQLNSNSFRLMVDSINQRVKTKTSGVVKQIIAKQAKSDKDRNSNRYKFINEI